MNEKRWDEYINEILSFVKFKYDHKTIRRELQEHMEDLYEDLMAEGMDEAAAAYMTVEYMGEAAEIGQELDQEHHALLGWVWRITRVLAIIMIIVTLIPVYYKVSGMISNWFDHYEPPEGVTEVWQIELDQEYEIYDDILMLEDIYYYDDGSLDLVYRTRKNLFARSNDWSFSIGIDGYDSNGNRIPHSHGGGFKQGGNYGFGYERLNEVKDIRTLKIYCTSHLTLLIDLETREVTEDAEA